MELDEDFFCIGDVSVMDGAATTSVVSCVDRIVSVGTEEEESQRPSKRFPLCVVDTEELPDESSDEPSL